MRMPEIWLLTSTQQLYGEVEMATVDAQSRGFAALLNASSRVPVTVMPRPVVTTDEALRLLCIRANDSAYCIGVIFRIESFPRDRPWSSGMESLEKPCCIVHAAPGRTVPRFGTGLQPPVFVGHFPDPALTSAVSDWVRAALGTREYSAAAVLAIDPAELEDRRGTVRADEAERLFGVYRQLYEIPAYLLPGGDSHGLVLDQARTELAVTAMLAQHGARAFTPPPVASGAHGGQLIQGLAVQRLMGAGFGFAPIGEPETARLVRVLKVMGIGEGGTTFLDSPTYSRSGLATFGAYALEICPSVATPSARPTLGASRFGDRTGSPRLTFDVAAGSALNVGVTTEGDHPIILSNPVRLEPPAAAPLAGPDGAVPVILPYPDRATAGKCWAAASGPRYTALSTNASTRVVELMAGMLGADFASIDHSTTVRAFRQALKHWDRGEHG